MPAGLLVASDSAKVRSEKMRMRTVIGLAVAAGAAAVAAGVGGTALAAAQTETSVPVVAEVSPAVPLGDGGTASTSEWDCPEKSGSSGSAAADEPAAATL
ncbi:hypothetical protein Ait01nite_091630 [Actinoplanes italicus]|nr:hypothetical protein Ait01nite_091630 [Actinoplanes italicus]